MRSRGQLIERKGKRGTTFTLRYRDADGRRVSDALGRVTRPEAEAALRARLVPGMSPAALMARGRTVRLQDDTGLHRPRRRDVSRGGALLDERLFGQKSGQGVVAASPAPATESLATAELSAAKGRILAAGVGFEPTAPGEGRNGFQDRPVRPLRHPAVERW
jgi:hypothetical protein